MLMPIRIVIVPTNTLCYRPLFEQKVLGQCQVFADAQTSPSSQQNRHSYDVFPMTVCYLGSFHPLISTRQTPYPIKP